MKNRSEIVDLLKTATAVFVVYFVVYSVFVAAILAVYNDYSEESLEMVRRKEIRLNSSQRKSSGARKHRYSVDFESTLSQLAPNFGSLKDDCYFDLDRCFDLYKCATYDTRSEASGLADVQQISRLRVHVYEQPANAAWEQAFSAEFIEFAKAIVNSRYYEPDPGRACLFVPMVDFMDENRVDSVRLDSYLKK